MNIRKIISIILILAMVLSFSVGCDENEKPDNTVAPVSYTKMDEVVIDFETTTVDGTNLVIQYEKDKWIYDEIMQPDLPQLFESATVGTEFVNNVNIALLSTSDEKMSQNTADAIIKDVSVELKDLGGFITANEIYQLGETILLMIDQTATLNDEIIDRMASEGFFDAELVKDPVIREKLKKTRQSVAFYTNIDDRLLIITGTYSGDDGREAVLEMMKILVQTMEIK